MSEVGLWGRECGFSRVKPNKKEIQTVNSWGLKSTQLNPHSPPHSPTSDTLLTYVTHFAPDETLFVSFV